MKLRRARLRRGDSTCRCCRCLPGSRLVLAAIGIYGVMSNAVTQRTQEIGIRLALGARTIDVLKLIIRNGLTLVIIGVAIGLAGAFALTRLMTTLLFGVTPTDGLTIVVVSAVLIGVALLACFDTGAQGDESRSAGRAPVRVNDDDRLHRINL